MFSGSTNASFPIKRLNPKAAIILKIFPNYNPLKS